MPEELLMEDQDESFTPIHLLALAVAAAPFAIAIGLVKFLTTVFPSADAAMLLMAVAIPEAAVIYTFGVWRRHNRTKRS